MSPPQHTQTKKKQKHTHTHNMAYLCNYSSFASLITPPHTSFCPPHVFLFFPLASLFPLSAPFPPHRHIPLSSPLLSPSSSETRTPPPRPPEALKDFSDNYGKSGFPETGKWPRNSSPRCYCLSMALALEDFRRPMLACEINRWGHAVTCVRGLTE